MSNDKVYTYKGQPIAELSREDLIEALEHAIDMLGDARKRHTRTLDMWEAIDAARKRRIPQEASE